MAISFLKRGKDAREAYARAEAEAEVRAAQNKAHRFWVPKDGEATITFLDGKLNSDGMLDVVAFNEHRLFLNGHWRNFFPCTASEEPCPLCEQDNQPSLVTVFTVIDHSKWKDRNGKTHRNERKLFVAKRDTVKRLQKLASKRGGLAGWKVTVGRVGDRAPEVGTDFDFIEKVDLKSLATELKMKPEDVLPFDYDEVIHYFTADELREAGFGTHIVGQHDTKTLRKQVKKPVVADDDDDDDDVPVAKAGKKAAKPIVDDDDDDDAFDDADEADDDDDAEDAADDDDDEPKPKKAVKKAPAPSKPVKTVKKFGKKAAKPVVEDDDDDADDDDDDDA